MCPSGQHTGGASMISSAHLHGPSKWIPRKAWHHSNKGVHVMSGPRGIPPKGHFLQVHITQPQTDAPHGRCKSLLALSRRVWGPHQGG